MDLIDEERLSQRLIAEGYTRTYVWQDAPNAHYSDHAHAEDTAHIILDGEMTLLMGEQSHTYRAGDRVDVPADTVHSATMGSQGCRYLIGERCRS